MTANQSDATDPEGVFIWGVSFEGASRALYQAMMSAGVRVTGTTPLSGATPAMLMIPSSVNSAFACELYLKCLLLLQIGTKVKTHNLERLFGLLPMSDQSSIEKHYTDYLNGRRIENDGVDLSDIHAVLRTQGNTFDNRP